MKPILFISLLLYFLPLIAVSAQNAPITTCATVQAGGPGTIQVPVTVTGFNNIGAISLTLDYQYAVLQFMSGAAHPSLPGFISGDIDLGNGYHRVTMSWFGSGISLPDGSAIITLTFNYITGSTSLTWYDDGSSCEYADENYNVLNDIPTEDYYIDGYVCALLQAPGPVTGNTEVCSGSTDEIYSIDPVPDAIGYAWTVPAGANIVSGQNTNAITVNFSPSADSGYIEVSGINPCGQGPSTQLFVNVNELPVADAGDDFTMNYGTSATLQAAPGGTDSYSYHWSPEALLIDPNVQNPQTVIMTSSAVFTLLVTNLETLCESSDQVMVTITGGPLSVNPVAIPGNICSGGSSQLFANAGGGSGNYTYLWTSIPAGNPPWSSTLANPVVTPDSTTLYVLSVNDGFTTTNGTANLSVHPLPTATISGGDTLCGSGSATILTVDLTGTPPWNFTYTYGNTSVYVFNQYETPYLITTMEPGVYTISYIEDAFCTGVAYGSAQVSLFPIPPTPEITVSGTLLTSSASSGNQWYLDDEPIPGATDQTYQVVVSGIYHVVVTLNGCSSEPSEPVDITVGIGENHPASLSIRPNPTRDRIHIQIAPSITGKLKATLHSTTGSIIHEFDISGNEHSFTLDTSSLPRGIYLLTIRGDNFIINKKLILQ